MVAVWGNCKCVASSWGEAHLLCLIEFPGLGSAVELGAHVCLGLVFGKEETDCNGFVGAIGMDADLIACDISEECAARMARALGKQRILLQAGILKWGDK